MTGLPHISIVCMILRGKEQALQAAPVFMRHGSVGLPFLDELLGRFDDVFPRREDLDLQVALLRHYFDVTTIGQSLREALNEPFFYAGDQAFVKGTARLVQGGVSRALRPFARKLLQLSERLKQVMPWRCPQRLFQPIGEGSVVVDAVEGLLDRDQQFADNYDKLEDLVYESIEIQLCQRVEWLNLRNLRDVADRGIADAGFAACLH